MASAWGDAWGVAWGDAWGAIAKTAEVTWPGTTIPRETFRDMQRAALRKALDDEYLRQKANARRKKPKPTPRKQIAATVRQIIRAADDAAAQELREPIAEAVNAGLAPELIKSILQGVLRETAMVASARRQEELRRQEQALEDEFAAIILLLAA